MHLESREASLGPVRAIREKSEECNQCGMLPMWNVTNVMVTIHTNFVPH